MLCFHLLFSNVSLQDPYEEDYYDNGSFVGLELSKCLLEGVYGLPSTV